MQVAIKNPVNQTGNIVELNSNDQRVAVHHNDANVRTTKSSENMLLRDNLNNVRPQGRPVCEMHVAVREPQVRFVFNVAPPPVNIIPISLPSFLGNTNCGAGHQTAFRLISDRSIFPLILVPHISTGIGPGNGPDPRSKLIEIIRQVAQLVIIITGGESLPALDTQKNGTQGSSNQHNGGIHYRALHALRDLLHILINELTLREGSNDLKQVSDLVKLEKNLSLVLKNENNPASSDLLNELSSCLTQLATSTGQKSIFAHYTSQSNLLQPNDVLSSERALNPSQPSNSAKPDALIRSEKQLAQNLIISKQDRIHSDKKATATEIKAGHESSIHNNVSQQPQSTTNQLVNSLLKQLTNNLALITGQPMPVPEAGQKQLPPIILPNTSNPGHRSSRRKSKKQLKKEKERESERKGGYGFNRKYEDDDWDQSYT